VCDPDDGMHALFSGLMPTQHFVDVPSGGFEATEEAIDSALSHLEQTLSQHHKTLAAMIVEPIMQGAGGMIFYSPLYLSRAYELCKAHDVLMIFDEVATGFGRTGKFFAAEHAGITPDIMVLGKGMTAGFTGHAATLATSDIYDAFWSDHASRCFMHGPTFMGNPLACAAANQSIALFEQNHCLEKIAHIETILKNELCPITSSKIKDTRALGAVGVIEAHDKTELSGLRDYAAERGVWIRPFDNIAYTMPPYCISDNDLRHIISVLAGWFS